MEVVCPGTEGDVRLEGISENQYRKLNEFPLSELSRSWAGFAYDPILEQEYKKGRTSEEDG